MSARTKWRHIRRRNSISKADGGGQGYNKDANAVYRGILRDRAKRYVDHHLYIQYQLYVQINLFHVT